MHEERFFDADAGGDFADGEAGGVRLFAIDADDGAFKNLGAKFFAFFDFLGDANGVTGTDVDDSGFFLGVSYHL